jgi:predicted metal-dependent hydrolase
MKEPASVRAEVIVHELLHLKVPDHGKVFKALLRPYLADHTGKDLDGTYEPAIPTLTIVMRVLR